MVDNGVDYDMAVLYVFLIYTPVLFLFVWGLEVVIDTPAKNFAYALDIYARYEAPKRKDGEEDDRTTWKLISE